MSIQTVHHNLPITVSKGIIKSMIGSLNATVIGYTRGHLKFGVRQMPTDRIPTIDDHNDEMAAVNEAVQRAQASRDMGFEARMPNIEIIERMMALRAFFCDRLMQMQALKIDVPLTIAETVKFQCEGNPSSNDSLIEALAAACDLDPEELKLAKLQLDLSDAADLRANAGKIVDFLGQYEDVDFEFDDDAVEANFAGLPTHVQYKLMSAAIRAHDKAQQSALKLLLRQGKLDAAGDLKMIKANRSDLITWLTVFSRDNQDSLDAYLERGGVLPALEEREIVVANVAKVKVEALAEKFGHEPKVIGKAKRAPKTAAASA